ncbi:hypothetical protein FM103_13265 [Corynebacterium xerosis]|nr:hypothetical protein FM103_13265 [Corynebacterium xerosis]
MILGGLENPPGPTLMRGASPALPAPPPFTRWIPKDGP